MKKTALSLCGIFFLSILLFGCSKEDKKDKVDHSTSNTYICSIEGNEANNEFVSFIYLWNENINLQYPREANRRKAIVKYDTISRIPEEGATEIDGNGYYFEIMNNDTVASLTFVVLIGQDSLAPLGRTEELTYVFNKKTSVGEFHGKRFDRRKGSIIGIQVWFVRDEKYQIASFRKMMGMMDQIMTGAPRKLL